MSTPHPDPSAQQPSRFAPPPDAGQPAPAQPDPYGQQHTPYPGGQQPSAQPGYQYAQPQPTQAPEKPRKSWFARHKVLTGLGGIVVVAIIGANLGGGGGEDPAGAGTGTGADTRTREAASEPDEGSGTEPDAAEKLPGVGDAVRDGKFEFTVTELEDGVQQIGDEFLNEKAQGQFVLVHMTVQNIGDEAQYFDGSSQKMVDTEGRTHSADSEAAIYLDESNSFLNEINPGNTVEGVVVFDIPKKATPATLELHDSMFSGGVEVAVK